MNNVREKENLTKLTVTTEPSLLDSVEQHRRKLAELTGLRISTSAAISALIRAGLEASRH